MLKSLSGRIILYGLAPQVSKVASFFVLPIITKDLSALDYGVAGLVTAYTSAFGVFQNLGFNVVLSNSFYKSPNGYKWKWRQVHGFLSLWSLVFAALLAVILYYVIPSVASPNKGTIILLNCLPAAFLTTTENITYRFYHLSQKAKILASRSIIVGVAVVLVNLYTISYLKLGYMGWFISGFVGAMLSTVVFSFPIYLKYRLTPIFNFKRKSIGKDLKVALPTVPHFYSGYLLNMSDRIVLDVAEVNVRSIGMYNLAYTFGNYFSAFVDAVSLAVSPTYLQLYKQNSAASFAALRKLTFILQITLLAIGFLISIWIREIFQLLIKNEVLQTAYPIATIVIMSYTYRPLYLAAINKIFFTERTKALWKVTLVAGILNIILNIIFIPIFGIIAAAVNTFISFMYMGLSGFFLREYKKDARVSFYPIRWLTLIVGTLVSALLLANVPTAVKIICSILVISILAFFFFKSSATFRAFFRNESITNGSSFDIKKSTNADVFKLKI